MLNYYREAQISLRFALRSFVFQTIEVFSFSISYNGKFEIFEKEIVKNRKLKILGSHASETKKKVKNRKVNISKIPNSIFVTNEKKIQKKRLNIDLKE